MRIVVFLFGLLMVPSMALALPIDAAQCTLLDIERKRLAEAGADLNLARGPDWAKANLKQPDVAELIRYLEIKEQVLFRCPSLHPDIKPDPAQGDDIYGPPPAEKPKPEAAKPRDGKKPAEKRARKTANKAAPAAATATPFVPQ